MGKAAVIVAIGVLASRVLGLVRQIVFAYVLGAGEAADEYFVAFFVPDLLNYLLAGAYLAITLIPILSRYLAEGDETGAWNAFWAVARPLTIAMTLLVMAAMPFVDDILRLVEPGFSEDQIADATRLTRIVLPAQIFFILGQLLTAVQFARERFLIPSIGPIVYNVGIIAGGLLGARGPGASADGFAWGALAGAIAGTFVLQWYGARAAGLRGPIGSLRRHPDVRRYFMLAVPLMLGQSLVVLDEQLGRSFGSLLGDGAISWLTFGRQTMLVPVGVIAQAAGVAAYPFLARLAAEGDLKRLAATMGRAIRAVVVLSLAAGAALMALARPVVSVLYERGEFLPSDTVQTAQTVVLFALAIPVWGAQQILARGFYAREQMWAPVVIGTLATAAAIPIYVVLRSAMGVEGLALASTISITLYTVALAVVWYRRTGPDEGVKLLGAFGRNLPFAAAGGLAAWGIAALLTPNGFIGDLGAIALGGMVAAAISLVPARRMGDV